MIQYRDREVRGEKIDIKSDDAYYLGPDLVLRDCTLVMRTNARAFTLTRAQLIGCTVEAKKKLNGVPWYRARLKGCSFTGSFAGCDFGYWPEAGGPDGAIEDCDFSGATLDGCRFIGCDAATLSFPSWPCFTVLNPHQRAAELGKHQWPGTVGVIVQTFPMYPPSTTAVTLLATSELKNSGASESEFRAMLEKIDGIIL